MMQLKGLNFFRIPAQYMKSISAKFDIKKLKQNQIRALLVKIVSTRSPKWAFGHIGNHLCHLSCPMYQTIYITFILQKKT